MKVITVAITKGGAGKTATSLLLARAFARDGSRCLLVDLDPQANASMCLGIPSDDRGVYQFINGDKPYKCIWNAGQNLDVIPGNRNLATMPAKDAGMVKRALSAIAGNYDIIMLDTPPNMGAQLYNALYASAKFGGGCIIPMASTELDLQGIDNIKEIAEALECPVLGAIITRYVGRGGLDKAMANAIREKLKQVGIPLLGVAREGIAVRESFILRKDLYGYKPKSKPAEDYMNIYHELKGVLNNGKDS